MRGNIFEGPARRCLRQRTTPLRSSPLSQSTAAAPGFKFEGKFIARHLTHDQHFRPNVQRYGDESRGSKVEQRRSSCLLPSLTTCIVRALVSIMRLQTPKVQRAAFTALCVHRSSFLMSHQLATRLPVGETTLP